jgi:hypothetical protein
MKHIFTAEEIIETLHNRIEYIGRQFDTETIQVADFRNWYEDYGYEVTDELKEIDREIIRRAEELAEHIKDEGNYDDEMKHHWVWNPGPVSRGEFPLENIPEHIRDLAQELYYD